MRVSLFALALIVSFSSAVQAKPAKCFTTDDGYYKCDFKATSSDGSFEVKAKGKPVYSLIIDTPGFAFGYMNMGGNGIAIGGMFVRQTDDPACWNNPEMNTKLCAW